MNLTDKHDLQQILDQVQVEEPSANFEQKLFQDWQRIVLQNEQPPTRLSEVMVLAKSHPKLSLLVMTLVLMTSVLLGQYWMASQDEELHRIDALSELSLSTM